jgi:hypothetical protein
MARMDTVVVVGVEALLVHPLEFVVDALLVGVGIGDERVGVATPIGGGLAHL